MYYFCSAPSLQSLCIYSLANTEAGQAVVNIMGVGVDTINMVLAAQPSRYVLIEPLTWIQSPHQLYMSQWV